MAIRKHFIEWIDKRKISLNKDKGKTINKVIISRWV